MAEEKRSEPKSSKKPYRKPEIKSGQFPEHRALACLKVPGVGGPECTSGFAS